MTHISIIYGIDESDDWKKPESYVKANPSIDTIIDRKILEQDLQDALGQPSHQTDYKAKTLNIWTSETSNWISLQKWDTVARNEQIDISEFHGQSCFAGLDLSSINDFTAYTKCFEKNGKFYLYHKFYVPSEQIFEKYRVENINIKNWVDNGLVTATPGATIDYDYIIKDIKDDYGRFVIQEMAYDIWQSNKLINNLESLVPKTILAEYSQRLEKISNPSKEFERLVLEDRIVDPNPVNKWMVSNAVIKIDVNGNYKPLKEYKSSTKKIDGVITSIMAIDRCMVSSGTTNKKGTVEQVRWLFS